MRRLVLLALLLVPAAGAFAQSAVGVHLAAFAEAQSEPVLSNPHQLSLYAAAGRSRSGAWTYALVGTLVPTAAGLALIAADPVAGEGDLAVGSALVGLGLLVGPSAGHLYLGDRRRMMTGVGIRAAGAVLGSLLAMMSTVGTDEDATEGALLFFLVAGTGYGVGAIYSLATLNRSARERGFAVVPGVRLDGSASFTLAARF